jgi:hypothetical protein
MTIRYSASAAGFFDTALHRDIPDDAVTVTARRHAALLAGQADGYEIVPDARGRPQLRSLTPTNRPDALAQQVKAIKREAARRIDQRMPVWRQLNALRENTDPGFHTIDAIRAASTLIEAQLADLSSVADINSFPVATHPLWPDFDTAGDED